MKKLKMGFCLLLAALTTASLSACGGNSQSSDSTGSAGELNIFVWTEYVPDSVIEQFEEETGIKVNVSTYSSNEDMLAKVKSEGEGTYDIVQPTDYMVEQMISQGLLQELDQSKLTNLSNIGESYLNPSYDPGNVYSVPYQGGAAAIAVNTSKVPSGTITSYADLFDSQYANSMVVLDDFRAIIGMAAKSLGYSMSETDPDKLAEISERLLSLKDNIKLYDSDSPKSALISGDCYLGVIWSAEIALAMDENPDIEIVYPSEGAYLFMDNWCVTKGAKNYDQAMEFINYMLKPETAQMVMQEYPYLNPNTTALEGMEDDYKNNTAKNPPAEDIAKGEYIKNLDTDTLAIYDQMWTELKK
ncbi:MAG: extracellular solute-binding protein family 1 [Oscillospiraceae bacterium]|nr:extracellular solute-binding protein family 1 [Oscillospiraceae bacterium]